MPTKKKLKKLLLFPLVVTLKQTIKFHETGGLWDIFVGAFAQLFLSFFFMLYVFTWWGCWCSPDVYWCLLGFLNTVYGQINIELLWNKVYMWVNALSACAKKKICVSVYVELPLKFLW